MGFRYTPFGLKIEKSLINSFEPSSNLNNSIRSNILGYEASLVKNNIFISLVNEFTTIESSIFETTFENIASDQNSIIKVGLALGLSRKLFNLDRLNLKASLGINTHFTNASYFLNELYFESRMINGKPDSAYVYHSSEIRSLKGELPNENGQEPIFLKPWNVQVNLGASFALTKRLNIGFSCMYTTKTNRPIHSHSLFVKEFRKTSVKSSISSWGQTSILLFQLNYLIHLTD